jgi:drug/metabolite transporter (DMT)-like permease
MPVGPVKYYALLVLTMAVWGGSWVSAKIVVAIAPPLTVGFFRFLIASLFFTPLMLVNRHTRKRSYTKRDVFMFFLLGLTGIFGYGVLFLTGEQFTTAAQGAIIAGINPTTVSIFAHIIHKERLQPRWRYAGFILSFLGIVFVVGVQSLLDFDPLHLLGNIIILSAMLMWGLYSTLGKTTMQTSSSLEATSGGVFFGTILFGVGAASEQFWLLPAMVNPVFWLNVLFMGVFVTVLGFFCYFLAIKNLGATRSAIFISLVPVFGTVFSALILFETIYWTFIVGILLVAGGILLINYPRPVHPASLGSHRGTS